MPLRLNVGVSKKLGLPEYSSVGASCSLDLELERPAPRPRAFQPRSATPSSPPTRRSTTSWPGSGQGRPRRARPSGRGPRADGSPPSTAGPSPGPRPACPAAKAGHAEPGPGDRHDRPPPAGRPGGPAVRARRHPGRGLSLADASRLIDQLKAAGRA